MNTTQTTSPKLAAILKQSAGITDMDRKPERMLEFHAMNANTYAADHTAYHAEIDAWLAANDPKTADPAPMRAAIAPLAPAARWYGEAEKSIRYYTARMRNMFGDAVTDEWIAILADRYPAAPLA